MTTEKSVPTTRVSYFGQFKTGLPAPLQTRTIVLSPSKMPLQWRDSHATAEELAEYFAAFFPGDEAAEPDPRAEMRSSISYIANELIENAVKFHFDQAQDVTIKGDLYPEEFILTAHNSVDPQTMPLFLSFIEELLSDDPGMLLLRQLETGLDSLSKTTSGIGFLTMMNDYQASLGWKFEYAPGPADEEISVSTMACLPIPKEFQLGRD